MTRKNSQFFFKKTLKSADLALLFRELSLLLEAGISLQMALSELAQSTQQRHLQTLLQRLLMSLKSGQDLSLAFENSGFAFHKSELALIKMGENTGDLGFVFAKLCELRERSISQTKALKKAFSYPIFVFCSLILAFCALMIFVVPQFKGIFDEFELNLPFITRAMLGIYAFLSTYYAFMLAFLGLAVLLMVIFYKNSRHFRFITDYFVLKIPILGKVLFYSQATHFFLLFSFLVKSGVNAAKSLELAQSSFSNAFLAHKCTLIGEFMRAGVPLNEAFKKSKLFEPLVIGMLSVAMKSAKLDFMSEKISQYYSQRQEDLTDRLLRLIEPLLTLCVAVLVLFLALAIFLPMWELNQSVNL